MFDDLTKEKLKFYVYCLIDPRTERPFYIGKGKGNRVFEHAEDSLNESLESDKLAAIRAIHSEGNRVKTIVIRHGLTEDEAFKIEASLIDTINYFSNWLTNEVLGHGALKFGLMTTSELARLYNAQPLDELLHPAVIININKTYERGNGQLSIYEATKEAWVISEKRRNSIKYALSEYQGIIVEAFKIESWYQCLSESKNRNRWGFNGAIAEESIRAAYVNKSVRHVKKRGAANPIRYNL